MSAKAGVSSGATQPQLIAMQYTSSRGCLLFVVLADEGHVEGPAQRFAGQFVRLALEADQVDGVRDHVARLAASELLPGLQIALVEIRLQVLRVALDLLAVAEPLENLDELLQFRRAHEHLVLDSAQKRLVAQLMRAQVRGEHQE